METLTLEKFCQPTKGQYSTLLTTYRDMETTLEKFCQPTKGQSLLLPIQVRLLARTDLPSAFLRPFRGSHLRSFWVADGWRVGGRDRER
jgi:hypothetical protein